MHQVLEILKQRLISMMIQGLRKWVETNVVIKLKRKNNYEKTRLQFKT